MFLPHVPTRFVSFPKGELEGCRQMAISRCGEQGFRHVRICVDIFIYTSCICTYIYMYTHTYLFIHLYLHQYLYERLHVYLSSKSYLKLNTYLCTFACPFTRIIQKLKFCQCFPCIPQYSFNNLPHSRFQTLAGAENFLVDWDQIPGQGLEIAGSRAKFLP